MFARFLFRSVSFVFHILLTTAVAKAADGALPASSIQVEYQQAVDTYLHERDLFKAKGQFLNMTQREPRFALAYYQLGILAERERRWWEASHWFEQFLELESATPLAAKLRKEIDFLSWAMLFETTPAGLGDLSSRKLEDEARQAATKQDWFVMTQKAREALRADPNNLDAGMLLAVAEMQLGHHAFADMTLRMLLTLAPAERKPAIEQALAQNRIEREFAEKHAAADALFRSKKRSEAGDAYTKLWVENPSHYELVVLALECYVLAESYTKAQGVVQKLAAAAAPTESLPTGLRDLPGISAQLDQLAALGSRGQVASKAVASKSKSKNEPSKPKSMADDFLSRIKKK